MAPRKRAARPTRSQDRATPDAPAEAPPDASADAPGALGELDPEQHPAPAANPGFPVVGIGASAGGLAAYEAFFSALPAGDTGMAFVIVQHLSPDHKSLLSELVRRYTRMQVREAEHNMLVEPDCAYIIPPNRDMALAGGRLRLLEPSAPRGQRLPIDFFFRTLASEQHERAICVVLSGTGSDGTLGLRAIKGEGGMAMAQSPDTTEHDGMPRSAIATGLVDYVLPPGDMPAQLIAYARHAFTRTRSVQASRSAEDGTLKKLTTLLRAHSGHDFSQYKSTTLVRRMERRMALHQIETPDAYLRYARENAAEIDALFRDLLIGVTNLFRDPEAFRVLEEKVIPRLLEEKAAHDYLRVWVCGCSTGEEAYSIAILVQEQLERMQRPLRVQIFATDIDRLAIEQARAGVFPSSIAADVTPERLARFFTHDPERDTYRAQKVIRDLLVFSEQDVIKDPPFSRLDLISCRNLLIYLNGEVQRKLIPLFHYALRPGGVLFLGTSETVGEFSRLFTPIERKWKLYRREAVQPGEARPTMGPIVPSVHERRAPRHPGHLEEEGVGNFRQLTEQALLAHYAEAGLLINGRGEILHIFGRTGKYLEPASGEPGMNVLSMAREGLRRELATALHKVVAHRGPAHYRGLIVRTEGNPVTTDLTVRPIDIPGGGPVDLYLVVLQEAPQREPAPPGAAIASGPQEDARVLQLEQELRAKEEYLQTTLEEMETTNEELKSTNEEMQSVNEELQSTNEELETSKEELQSVNEELSTVNAELQDKVADLSRANNDMNNLLAGTGVGTVFVDHQLRISRFTPSATQVINLIPGDIGRPVEHIVSNLVGYDRLGEDLHDVLEHLVTREAEVRTKSGAWYLMRIRPYRTTENVIEGVVLTFVDISERKRAEHALRESEARFEAIFNQALVGVSQTDPSGRFVFANDRYCEMLGYGRAELLHRRIAEVRWPGDQDPAQVRFEALLAGGPDFQIETRYRRKDGSPIWVRDRVSGIRGDARQVISTVIVSLDVSARRRLETAAGVADATLAGDLEALSRLEVVESLSLNDANRQAVLDEILESAMALAGADMGQLQLVLAAGTPPVLVAHRGLEQPFIDAWNRSAGDAAALGGERVIIEDLRAGPALVAAPPREALLAAGMRAVQALPLVDRSGRVLGRLLVQARVPGRPDAQTLRFLEHLARQAADLIERSNRGAPGKDTSP